MNFNKNKFKDFQIIYLGKGYFNFYKSLTHSEEVIMYDFRNQILKRRDDPMLHALGKILKRVIVV